MTTFEHALLGMNGAVICGLHRRWGWSIVALAGVAAVAPDWDGITFLFHDDWFYEGHRVWGHNIWACVLVGLLLGVLDYRFDIALRIQGSFKRRWPLASVDSRVAESTTNPLRTKLTMRGYLVWITVGVVAALSQIPADLVVSGTRELPDWPLKIFWPLSDVSYTCPLVYWGDPVPTILFAGGMLAWAKWPQHLRLTSGLCLLSVWSYVLVYGFCFREASVAGVF